LSAKSRVFGDNPRMPLAFGTRLGPYEILGPLGAGGMGEVYRAKDTRLGRDVAVKILPAHLSENAEVRERFEREARAISSLNHPHICTLYDIGREGEADYFVMELLDGESLSARLERGPLKLEETLRIGAQIADALSAAHKQGIVHRDLKPGNIALTRSGAKVLDFGVAKLRDEAVIENVTRTTPLTSHGAMVGTVQYMSPEQLEGKPVDHRADLFAFGAVLYEMLTGKRAFEGKSQASVIASILKDDPRPVSQLIPTTPAAVDRVVTSCLAKDPDERWQSAGDLSRELRWIGGGASPVTAVPTAPVDTRRTRSASVAWTLAAVATIAAIASLAMQLTRTRPPVSPGALTRFSIASPAGVTLVADGVNARISPDGRTLAFSAVSATGTVSFWVRALDSLVARPLVGTEDGALQFWSPDGRYLAYFGSGKLSRVPIAGGAPEAICPSGEGRGGTWGRDGVIVFAPQAAGPLFRVRESGGEVVPVTVLDEKRQETGHRWPCFLPDGKHFLFVTLPAKQGNFDVFVGSIDSHDRKFLFAASSAPIYAEPGYLIYMRDRTLVAHRFDASDLATKGDPVSLGEAPAPSGWTGAPVVSASNDGVLARWGMGLPNTTLQWYDRAGKAVGEVPVPAGRFESVRLSPNGKHLATVKRSGVSASDIWLFDLDHPVPSRFTFGPSINYWPAWSPDGSRIAFASDRFGPEDIFVKSVNGAAEETAVLKGGALFKEPSSWSADGKTIVFEQPDPKTGWDLYLVSADGASPPVPFLRSSRLERFGVVSPDGRWIAYLSDEAGRMELFVQSFPVPGAKYQVSSGGASYAMTRWTRGGKELMFAAANGFTVMSAEVSTGASFHAGEPRALFKLRADVVGIDFAPDGERILATSPAGATVVPSITIDVNWTSQLPK
jgi:serine/threonine protein kinase/Tol biopolymer transport system component